MNRKSQLPPDEASEGAAQFERGVQLENSGDPNGARAAYERVVALDPDHAEAIASIAWIDAQAGDSASATRWGERALALDPANVLGRMALAFAGLHDGQNEAAARRLAALLADPALTPINRSIVLSLIGDLKDAEGDAVRAFKAYEAANTQLTALYPQMAGSGPDTPVGHAHRLIKWFEAADPKQWRHQPEVEANPEDPRIHAFLVGFPRSGTTLLETVLGGQPEVVTLDEKHSLAQAAGSFLTSDEGLKRLAAISSSEAQAQREAYWSAVRNFGVEPRGRVFIDKMPLATVLLPLISKLFPDARVLFAVRDPRDVVLSCFRRRFGMNAAMAQFLSLKSAAAYYDAVMRLGELYRSLLPTPQHVVRHEDLLRDFEGTTRSVCDFLDLEWSPAMADFAGTARSRGISTPSAPQLARGLNPEGKGAWLRYRDQMAPVLPVLEPWVQRFGYEPS